MEDSNWKKILKNREQIVEASMPWHYMVWLDILQATCRLEHEIEHGIFHSFIHSSFLLWIRSESLVRYMRRYMYGWMNGREYLEGFLWEVYEVLDCTFACCASALGEERRERRKG